MCDMRMVFFLFILTGTEFHQQTIGISKGFVLNFSEVVIISVVTLGIVLVITSIVIVVLITKGSLSLGR